MSVWKVQQALYARVSTDAGVVALGPQVVDFGPRVDDAAQIFPYVAMGSLIVGEWDTDRDSGYDIAFRIHTYSDEAGSSETRQIQDAIYNALHRVPLEMVDQSNTLVYREDSQVTQTSNGAFHGICEYRGLVRVRPLRVDARFQRDLIIAT